MHTLKQQAIAAFGAIAMSGLGIGCAAAADQAPPGGPEYYEGQNYGPAQPPAQYGYPPPAQYGYPPPVQYGYPPPAVYGYPPPVYYAPRVAVVPGPIYPRRYYGVGPYPYPRYYARHGHWRHW
jgi:hypothetical protein